MHCIDLLCRLKIILIVFFFNYSDYYIKLLYFLININNNVVNICINFIYVCTNRSGCKSKETF